jgi:protein O-mannosyl-transferase
VPFVFDDELAIVSNPTIRRLSTALFPPNAAEMGGLPISGRPIVNLSIAFNYLVGRENVFWYHVVNLLIHAVCGLLLFGVLRRTLLQPTLTARFKAHAFELALVASVLWTVHPLQTESVTYVSQRAEALLGLFYLFTVWCFIRALEPGAAPKWGRWAVAGCLLGMATKEVMVSAPIFAALYDRALVAGSWREVWRRRRHLLLALASTWLLLAWFVVRGGGTRGFSAGFGLGVSPWEYLLTQCGALVLYLKLSLWPHPLVLDYGTDIVRFVADVWWQGLVVLALLGATAWAVARNLALGCAGAWFFMILAPSSSVIPLVGQTIAEHRMYLPLAAIIVASVFSGYAYFGRKTLLVAAVAAIVLAAVTIRRNQDYATTIRICEDTVAKRPTNARAMALLADYYHRAGQLDPARRWLERSLEIQPDVIPVLNNLGNVWQELREPNKAIGYYQHILVLRPNDVTALNNLGNALIVAGRATEGISQLDTALRLAPQAASTRANLAATLAQSGRLAEAAEQFQALLIAKPDDPEIHAQFAGVLAGLGRRDEAISHLETSVRLQPDNADLHNQLGTQLGRAGRVREALAQFDEALRLNPSHPSAAQNAARARRLLGGN